MKSKQILVWDDSKDCFVDFKGNAIKNNDFVNDVTTSIRYLKSSNLGKELISDLSKDTKTVTIKKSLNNHSFNTRSKNAIINFDNNTVAVLGKGKINSVAFCLLHELLHAKHHFNGTYSDDKKNKNVPEGWPDLEEKKTVEESNLYAEELIEPFRYDYNSAQQESRHLHNLDITDCVNK